MSNLDTVYAILVHAIFAVGAVGLLAGFLLGFIPFIGRYKLPIQAFGVVLFSLGIWLEGGMAKDREWKAKMAVLEAELADARAKSSVVNTEIITKVVTKKQVIKEKGETITKWIGGNEQIVGSTCVIAKNAITAHNAAALNNTDLITNLGPDTTVPVAEVNAAAKPTLRLAPKK